MSKQQPGRRPRGKQKKTKKQAKRPYLPWHYMVAGVFEFLLRPRGYKVDSFVKVGTLPLEIDIVVVHQPQARSTDFERLDFIFQRLGPVTVIEYKGPDDDLVIGDFDRLLAYALLYRMKQKIARYADMTTMTISAKLGETYKQALRAEGIALVKEADGVYRGDGAMFRHFAIAVDELPKEEVQARPLLPLGRAHKGQFGPLFGQDPTELRLGHYLWSLAHANKEVLMQVFSDADLSLGLEGLRKKFNSLQTVEQRLEGLGAKERLEGLGPKERLAGLGPEEILSYYPPEELVRGLSREDRQRLRQLLEEEEEDE